MSKIIEFEQNLTKIWPKQNKVCFSEECEIVITLLKNLNNSWVGYVGGGDGDGGVGGCVGCIVGGVVGGVGGGVGGDGLSNGRGFVVVAGDGGVGGGGVDG